MSGTLHRPIIALEQGCARPPLARGENPSVGDMVGVCRRSRWFLLSRCVRDKQRSGGSLYRAHVGRRRLLTDPSPLSGPEMGTTEVELEEDEIQRKVEELMEQYGEMLPPDLAAVALRKLGIKCKTTLDNPENTGPGRA